MNKRNPVRPLHSIIVASLIAILFKTEIFDLAIVNGSSMQPALPDTSLIVINRAAFGIKFLFWDTYVTRWRNPQIGELIVFNNPHDGSLVVKRCVAVGPTNYCIDNYELKINNYTVPINYSQAALLRELEYVKQDELAALGDNFPVSIDSRDYGFIPVEKILGNVLFWF